MVVAEGQVGKPGFAFANSTWPQPTAALPFLDGGPTSGLAWWLGVDLVHVDSGEHLYETP